VIGRVGSSGGYHRARRGASDDEAPGATSPCPLCPHRTDRFGWCRIGHPAVQVRGVTYIHEDFRHNLCVDPDAPVVAWRQEKGHRLGYENSREAVAWSFFRSLDVLGVAAATLGPTLGTAGAPELYFWGRRLDATPWEPFADARAELERYVKGPDVNGAEPDLAIADPARRQVIFVDADVASPVAAKPPRWFAAAGTPQERRVRRAILDAMTAEEDPSPFRRGLDDAVRRGFYGLARRMLLSRASARRLGAGWSGRLVSVINPSTMRRAEEDVTRFVDLLGPEARPTYRAITWAELWAHVPPAARGARRGPTGTPLRLSLEEYLRARTINRSPAAILPPPTGDAKHVS
jgi:hypothetical protein